MNLNVRQKKVVDATDNRILCLSSAGSGKTRSLTERIRHLVEDMGVEPSKIVAISFTNMAAREMKMRLGDLAKNMFIGTIHSYANRVCALNNINMSYAIVMEDYDSLLLTASKIKEKDFPEVEHLLVDEAQDITKLEYLFINKIPAKNKFFVADDRQNIYQFKGGSDEYIQNMYKDINYKKYYLDENYRCAPNIMTFADDLLGSYSPLGLPCKCIKTSGGYVDDECTFEDTIPIIKESGNYGNWMVLTRTNKELEKAMEMLEAEDIPCITFKKADLENNEELNELMMSNSVKVLTIHSCMSGDTLVPTSEGLLRIDEIVRRKDKELLIYNGIYYDKVKDFIENGKEMTYTLTTKDGAKIRLTENHECIILTEDGLKKKKVFELIGNETLLMRKNIKNYQYKTVHLKQLKKEDLYFNTTFYPTPSVLDEKLGELIGMITADGTTNGKSIHYVKRHKECVEKFAQLIKECFDKKIEVKKASYEEAWIAECNSTHIVKFLYENFDGIQNNSKYISSKILQASQSIQCAFLRGLFEDGTVQIKRGKVDNISLVFKNNKMYTQLQTLLFTLGIDASFTTHNYKEKALNYCYIYVAGMQAFKEKVGFISDFKQNRLNTLNVKLPRKNNSEVLRQIMLKIKAKAYVSGQSQFWGNLQKNSTLTELYFNRYYDKLSEEQKNIEEITFIKNVFENYQIAPLASVEKYQEEETYCLTMEHENQFIQNGFLMGNSKGLERSNVVVIGAKVFSLEERKLAYVAATRAENQLYWCPSIVKGRARRRGENRAKFKRDRLGEDDQLIEF